MHSNDNVMHRSVRFARAFSGLIACTMAVSGPAFAASDAWDVTDTGQPYLDAEFTLDEGTWMDVDVSPDGNRILFVLLGDIYSMPAAGGTAVLVHGGPAMQTAASYSPDGTRIVYLSDASGSDNVWVSSADGSDARQVTNETIDVLAGPAWDPAGSYVAAAKRYGSFPAIRSSEIRLFHLDGGSGQLLVRTPANERDVHEPEFSDDGRFLYYTERIGNPSIFVDANHRNFAVKRRELETGRTEELIGGFGGATTPQVSPDGRRVAFVRRVKEKTVLFVLDLDTGRQRPVYDGLDRDLQADFMQQNAYYPKYDWFPDNRHVAIWGKGRLYRVDTDTGASDEIPFRLTARHRITTTARFEHDLAPADLRIRAIRHLAVAPDEAAVVFNALGHLWRMDLPDGTPRRLTGAVAFESEPAYAPDGRSIAYVAWDDERGSALKIVSAAGRNTRTLVETSGIIREPSFSPDGSHLVYRIAPPNRYMGGHRAKPGIYRVAADGGDGRFVTETGLAPAFSQDGRRIYYSYISSDGDAVYYSTAERVTRLESVNLDGFDRREHAFGSDVLGPVLSPDGRWLAFTYQKQYYLMPYRETGEPVLIGADSGAVPIAKLTALGGYDLAWSGDSRSLLWTLGPSLYRMEAAGAFDADEPAPAPYASIDISVPADAPEGRIAFTNARIITMDGDHVIERGTITVEGNRIAAVGPAGTPIPDGAKVIDAAGKTIMPGLVDMHGHIDCCYGTDDMMPQKQPFRYAALAFGVTTNYDPYSSDLPAYAVNETNLAGITVGPRAVSVGSVVYGRTRKYDFVFAPVRGIDDAERVMRRKQALGGQVIKSYKQPMRSQRQQLVRAGREAGIMVDVEGESHFHSNVSMVLDGHLAVEHNLPVANYYDDLVQLFAHSGVAHTPTLVIIFGELFGENYLYQTRRAWEEPKVRTYVQEVTASYSPIDTPLGAPPHVRGMTSIHVADELWDIGFRAVSRSMKKLNDAGVLINAGSHGQVAGLALHWEMWLLAEGGMPALDVLRTATLNGARTLALDRQIGSLEVGKLADLIVLDENPLENVENTNTVRYTMVNGRLYDALSMNEIGNYDRPRSRFYWELENYEGIDWNEAWAQ